METTETGTRRVMDLPALQRVVAAAAKVWPWYGHGASRDATETFRNTFHPETVGALLGEVATLRREGDDLCRIRELCLKALVIATGATMDAVREAPTGCAATAAAELADLRRRDAIVQAYIDTHADVDDTNEQRVRANAWTALGEELGAPSQHEVVRAEELARLRQVEAAAIKAADAADAMETVQQPIQVGHWRRARLRAAIVELRGALTGEPPARSGEG